MNTSHLIKDLKKIDQDDITSDWKWRLDGLGPIVLVSSIGDMFLLEERQRGLLASDRYGRPNKSSRRYFKL